MGNVGYSKPFRNAWTERYSHYATMYMNAFHWAHLWNGFDVIFWPPCYNHRELAWEQVHCVQNKKFVFFFNKCGYSLWQSTSSTIISPTLSVENNVNLTGLTRSVGSALVWRGQGSGFDSRPRVPSPLGAWLLLTCAVLWSDVTSAHVKEPSGGQN